MDPLKLSLFLFYKILACGAGKVFPTTLVSLLVNLQMILKSSVAENTLFIFTV